MGSGGLGGYFGGLLAAAGHQVTFIARGAHLDAIRRQGGIRLQTTHGDLFAAGDAAGAPPADPADLVLFTVKAYDTGTAAEAVVPAVGPQTAVLCLQNGVDNEERLAEMLGAQRILAGAVYIFAGVAGPGIVAQTGGSRRVVFGEWTGGRGDRVGRLEGAFREAGWLAESSDDIVREKWVKAGLHLRTGGDDGAHPPPHRRDPRHTAGLGDVPPDCRRGRRRRPRPRGAAGYGARRDAPDQRTAPRSRSAVFAL